MSYLIAFIIGAIIGLGVVLNNIADRLNHGIPLTHVRIPQVVIEIVCFGSAACALLALINLIIWGSL